MMTATVELMGGPAHGQVMVVMANDDGIPAREIPVSVMPAINWAAGLDDEVPPPTMVIYERQVSSLDDGPLWVYVPRRVV